MSQADGKSEAKEAQPQPTARGSLVDKGTGSFVGAVVALGGGATIAHIIAFGCAPVINRLFSPEAFGTAAMFAAIVLALGVVASLRYEAALMLPASDADAANLLVLSSLCVSVVSGLTAILVWLLGDYVVGALHAPQLARYKWLLPVGVLSWGLSLPLRSWAVRCKRFASLAMVDVAETSASSGGRIGTALAGVLGAGPLIVTGLVARALPAMLLAWRIVVTDISFIASNVTFGEIGRMARLYVRFPLIDSTSTLLGQLSRQIPYILLGALLGPAVVGHYSRAVLLTGLPILILGNAVRQALFQRVSAGVSAGDPVGEIVDHVMRRVIWLTALPLAIVAVIGPEVFTVVLGGQWARAGLYAQLLAAWFFVEGMAAPLLPLVGVLDRLGSGLAFSVALVAGQVAAVLAAARLFQSDVACIIFLVCVGVIAHGWLGVVVIRAAKASILAMAGCTLRALAMCLPVVGVLAGAKWWLRLSPWQMALLAAIGAMGHYAIVFYRDRWIREWLVGIILRPQSK